jgi:hypothetical protein
LMNAYGWVSLNKNETKQDKTEATIMKRILPNLLHQSRCRGHSMLTNCDRSYANILTILEQATSCCYSRIGRFRFADLSDCRTDTSTHLSLQQTRCVDGLS